MYYATRLQFAVFAHYLLKAHLKTSLRGDSVDELMLLHGFI